MAPWLKGVLVAAVLGVVWGVWQWLPERQPMNGRDVISTPNEEAPSSAGAPGSGPDESAASAGEQGVFECHLWPGEGRPLLEAVTRELELKARPWTSSETLGRIAVDTGEAIHFDDTRYRTLSTGRIIAQTDAYITGRSLGDVRSLTRESYYSGEYPEAHIPVAAGDVIEYLQHRAEDTCFVRVSGDVIDAQPCPAFGEAFRVEQEPEVGWWIHATVRGATGWIPVDGSAIRAAGRQF